MCRFLLVKSSRPFKPQKILRQFADMAEMSRTPDGDRQADGWGVAYKKDADPSTSPSLNSASLRMTRSIQKLYRARQVSKEWKVSKSLKPIWEDRDVFGTIPAVQYLAIHARSASFPQHKNNVEYNQPYISEGMCFVFNGILKRVRLSQSLVGTIGAQKIFSLLQGELRTQKPGDALKTVDQLLLRNAQKIQGMNIGLLQDNNMYALCEYYDNAKYFGLRYHTDEGISLVCSEPIGDYAWIPMKKGEVLRL